MFCSSPSVIPTHTPGTDGPSRATHLCVSLVAHSASYFSVDAVYMKKKYIESAKKRWRDRANCRFFCQKVEDAEILETEYYNIVLAFGIVHHLSDNEAAYLFNIAYQALKPGGALITYDNVWVE